MARSVAAVCVISLTLVACAGDLPSTQGAPTGATAAGTAGWPSAPTDPILNPEDVPRSVLSRLDAISLAIRKPMDWRGPHVVCTRIAEGWNDCISLSADYDLLPVVGAYVGETREVEVWLLPPSTLDPIERLGTIDLTGFDDVVATGDALGLLVLEGDYDPQRTDAAPVSNPTATLVELMTWDEARRSHTALRELFD